MSQQKTSVGKIIGFTCLGIIAVPILLSTIIGAMFTGGGSLGGIVVLLVIVGIILLVVNQNKKTKLKISAWEAQQVNQPLQVMQQQVTQQQAPIQTQVIQPVVAVSGVGFETSVCRHIFSEADLKDQEFVTCPCGYTFSVKKLRDYAQLTKRFTETQQKLVILEPSSSSRSRMTSFC